MEKNNKFPQNWSVISLGDVITPIKGKKPKTLGERNDKLTIPYITINAFEKNIFEKFTDDVNCPQCTENDVLMVWDGARSGLVGTGASGVIGSTITKLFCNEINPKYLYYFLKKHYDTINKNPKGIGIPHVNPFILWNLEFPIPPLKEQEKIVNKIKYLFSNLEDIKFRLEKIEIQLKQYMQSILNSLVTGDFVDGEKYEQKPISKVMESINQGWSPKCEKSSSINDEEWTVMTTTAIQPMNFDSSQNKKLPDSLEPRVKLELKENDLLITRAGPRKRVGIACLVKKTKNRLLLCDKAYRIRFDKSSISPSFFEIVLNSPHILAKIEKIKTGSNDSGLNLTIGKFSNLIIPLPLPEQQNKIVMIMEQKKDLIENIKNITNSMLSELETLRSSILKQAFEGKLVPQDPNDEPASELLKRIKLEN